MSAPHNLTIGRHAARIAVTAVFAAVAGFGLSACGHGVTLSPAGEVTPAASVTSGANGGAAVSVGADGVSASDGEVSVSIGADGVSVAGVDASAPADDAAGVTPSATVTPKPKRKPKPKVTATGSGVKGSVGSDGVTGTLPGVTASVGNSGIKVSAGGGKVTLP